jgi:hypothetical protein
VPTAAQPPAGTQETETISPPAGCPEAADTGPSPNQHTENTATSTASARAQETGTLNRPATEITTLKIRPSPDQMTPAAPPGFTAQATRMSCPAFRDH